MADMCEKCRRYPPNPNERYCKVCRKQVLRELDATGYLEKRVYTPRYRTKDEKEDTHVTKFGTNR